MKYPGIPFIITTLFFLWGFKVFLFLLLSWDLTKLYWCQGGGRVVSSGLKAQWQGRWTRTLYKWCQLKIYWSSMVEKKSPWGLARNVGATKLAIVLVG